VLFHVQKLSTVSNNILLKTSSYTLIEL